MRQPKNNGLFEMAGGRQDEKGFTCMKLIEFLTADGVSKWEEWHKAHLLAQSGECAYIAKCPIYRKTKDKISRT